MSSADVEALKAVHTFETYCKTNELYEELKRITERLKSAVHEVNAWYISKGGDSFIEKGEKLFNNSVMLKNNTMDPTASICNKSPPNSERTLGSKCQSVEDILSSARKLSIMTKNKEIDINSFN
jgi:DNA repair ATPase RecN